MIPIKLKLSNFTSYGETVPELDFRKIKMAAISGPNGAGKSSLLDAITWCLWGISRLGDSSDQLVKLGQDKMWVEFSFELDGHLFLVKRTRSLKSGGLTSLEFFSGQNNLTEGTLKTTQQKIIDTLHLTFETFINSAFLRQGRADEFTTKGPTDRKRILADILGLSHYDQLEEKAREKVKQIQSDLQLLDYQIVEIEAELTQKEDRSHQKKEAEETIAQIEQQIKTLETKLKTFREQKETLNITDQQRKRLMQTYWENKQELDEIIAQGKSRKTNIEKLKAELAKFNQIEQNLKSLLEIKTKKEELEKVRQEKLALQAQISQLQGVINLKKQEQNQLQQEISQINNRLAQAKKPGAKCPTCGQEMGKAEKNHAQQTLSEEKRILVEKLAKINLAKEEKELTELMIQEQALAFDEKVYQAVNQKLANLEQLQQQKEKFIQLQASLRSEEKTVEEMRVLFQKKKIQVDRLEQALTELIDPSDQLAKLENTIAETENQLAQTREKEKEARSELGQITQLISRTAQLEKSLKIKKEKKALLEKDKASFEELALAFGKKGLQAMIIEGAIPEIEQEANRLLDKLTEGRMQIRLETQRETKGKLANTGEKGIIETLDIIISDEMGERSYEAYSGGEQFRVNLALRLALSKLLTHRAGAKLQFLVIDEGFGTQDAQGRSKIVEALNIIKDDFAKILVITHLEELKEEFPVRIEVTKTPSGSTFEVIGVQK